MVDLLVLTELNPDVVVSHVDAVAFGQVEQLVDRAGITLGASGAITAAAAAAQGLSVAACGLVGADPLGAITLDLLETLGVDVSHVCRRPDLATGLTVVLTRPDGDRALLTHLGAIGGLRAADVPTALLADARHVHVSSLFLQRGLQPGLRELLSAARAGGATTSLDPGWDPDESWAPVHAVLDHLDYLLPNAAECAAIAALPDPIEAARSLAAQGPAVAVKLGAEGAALVTDDEIRVVRTTPVVPVDTTGAGDNFDAGFLAAVLDGADAGEALARAAASGTISVGGWGGTGRLATRTDAVAAARALTVEALPT